MRLRQSPGVKGSIRSATQSAGSVFARYRCGRLTTDDHALSPEDLGALIAYIKSVPPVDNVVPGSDIQVLGRALYLAGQIEAFHAESINHAAPAGWPN